METRWRQEGETMKKKNFKLKNNGKVCADWGVKSQDFESVGRLTQNRTDTGRGGEKRETTAVIETREGK